MMRSLPMATEVLPAEEGEAEGVSSVNRAANCALCHGKCHWGCDYCPLSENRRETPDMFANERRCTSWDEVIERRASDERHGNGITGATRCWTSKNTGSGSPTQGGVGPDHHIHAYTSIPLTRPSR